MEDLWLYPVVFIGAIVVFFCGALATYEPSPTKLTNNCIMYEEVYYCPTELPDGLVMPVE